MFHLPNKSILDTLRVNHLMFYDTRYMIAILCKSSSVMTTDVICSVNHLLVYDKRYNILSKHYIITTTSAYSFEYLLCLP